MSNHTPGPWYPALLPNTVIARPLLGDDAVAVASVGGRSKDECEANARLIAKAPQMFDALTAIADMKTTPDTNHAELCALMTAIARTTKPILDKDWFAAVKLVVTGSEA